MDVFEYYDDYEELWADDKEDRTRVQYIVLGVLNVHSVVICYIGEGNYICALNKQTHKKAWKLKTLIVEVDCIACIKNALKSNRDTIGTLRASIAYTIANKEAIDLEQNVKHRGYSSSCGGSSYTVHLRYGESYSAKYIKEMQKNIQKLQVAHARLDKLLYGYSQERLRNKSCLKIQVQFRHCNSDPSHAFCKKRLLREFSDLTG